MITIHRSTNLFISLAICLMLLGQTSGFLGCAGHVTAMQDIDPSSSLSHVHHTNDPSVLQVSSPCIHQMESGKCQMEAGCLCHAAPQAVAGMRTSELNRIVVTQIGVHVPYVHIQANDSLMINRRLPPSQAPPFSFSSAYKAHFSRTMRQLS